MNLSRTHLLEYLSNSSQPQTKRDIAWAFSIKGGPDRIALKKLLRELEEAGDIVKQSGGAFGLPEGLPSVSVIEISDIDVDGDVFAKIVDEKYNGYYTHIEVMPEKRGHPSLKEGDRALAALKKGEGGVYEARVIKRLDKETNQVLGLVTQKEGSWSLQPADKKARQDYEIIESDLNGAQEQDLAIGEIQPSRGMKQKKLRITEVIGNAQDPKAVSLLSLHEVGLRTNFPPELEAETGDMKVPGLKGREDLRSVPLITIDGADARDFDDAVFAEEAENGFHLIVAIADVAYYVRPGSALDQEALKRGNSTYFPDRVLPMLPEALSNDLCSLRPDEDRACLAAHMWVNKSGQLERYKFVRGIMRSHARCTYEQAQALYEEKALAKDQSPQLLDSVQNLYAAYSVLNRARLERGALDLDLPERQILINEAGNMEGVKPRTRLDAHRLIEEFMVLANVAAARALEDKNAPCVYRVHEPPQADKITSASEFIEGFGLSLPKGQVVKPKQLNHLLKKASDLPYAHLVHEVVLRCQSQARYNPENAGHFGLALSRYAHFTSPIRRYADLLVHRSLVRAYGLGPGGLADEEAVRLEEISEAISDCERRSIEAERNAIDRFTASFLADQVGAEFHGRINGVTRFGLFVTLSETGADGIVPIRSLKDDYYVHDEDRHALIGKRKGKIYRLGAQVTARLLEADGLTGSTVLELVGDKGGADIPGFEEPNHRQRANFHQTGPKSEDKKKAGKTSKPHRSGKKTLKKTPNSNKGKDKK